MPKSEKTSVLLRQIELLKQLPSRGSGKTASELTRALNDAGFSITKRQVERDLNELLEAFAIDRNDDSIPYGWKWGGRRVSRFARDDCLRGAIVKLG